MREGLAYALRHPFSQAASVVAGLFALLNPSVVDAVLATLWADPGTLFTLSWLLGARIGPHLEWVPEDAWTFVAIVAGLLLASKHLLALYRGFRGKLEERL